MSYPSTTSTFSSLKTFLYSTICTRTLLQNLNSKLFQTIFVTFRQNMAEGVYCTFENTVQCILYSTVQFIVYCIVYIFKIKLCRVCAHLEAHRPSLRMCPGIHQNIQVQGQGEKLVEGNGNSCRYCQAEIKAGKAVVRYCQAQIKAGKAIGLFLEAIRVYYRPDHLQFTCAAHYHKGETLQWDRMGRF